MKISYQSTLEKRADASIVPNKFNGSANIPLLIQIRHRFALASCSLLLLVACLVPVPANASLWVTAYFAGWQSTIVPSTIDFSTITHVIDFALVPNSNGTFSNIDGVISNTNLDLELVNLAHAAGRKVLVCVGGGNSEPNFVGATSSANLSTFVANITNFVSRMGYDGVDLDWEQFQSSDMAQYTNLVNALRTALNGFSTYKMLTLAVTAYTSDTIPCTNYCTMLASLQGQVDQINIMTYDMSEPGPGWCTWFNSPIYDNNFHFPEYTTELVPSIHGVVTNFTSYGIQSAKLGIGVSFEGYIWTDGLQTNGVGMTGPREEWATNHVPTATMTTYEQIMSQYYKTNNYIWDTTAQAAYLSYTNTPASNDMFITYDDTNACQDKVIFANSNHLGGLMIYELSEGFFTNLQTDPLLGVLNQSLTPPTNLPNIINIQFDGERNVPGPRGPAPQYVGLGPAGGGTNWNMFLADSDLPGDHDNDNLTVGGTNLLNSFGNPTSVGFTVSPMGGDDAGIQGSGTSTNSAVLFSGYIFNNAASNSAGQSPWTISGLGAVSFVDIYFLVGEGTITIPGATNSSFGGVGIFTPTNTEYFVEVPVTNGVASGFFGAGTTTIIYGMTIVIPPPNIINIQFSGNRNVPGPRGPAPQYVGQGPAGGGTEWNMFLANSELPDDQDNDNLTVGGTNLSDSFGKPTPVGFSVSPVGGDDAGIQGYGTSTNSAVLFSGYIFNNSAGNYAGQSPWTISGLGAASFVDIYFLVGEGTITIPGATQSSFGDVGIFTPANTDYFVEVPVTNGVASGSFGAGTTTMIYGMTIVIVPPNP